MRLADFIESSVEPILAEWEAFVRGIALGAAMDSLALRDNAQDILLATVRDMRLPQGGEPRPANSRCCARHPDVNGATDEDATLNGASEHHAVGRLGSGFGLLDLVSEYRALRASVLRLWHASNPELHPSDVDDLTRFNESIDQSLAEAVSSYTKRVDQSRDLFLAILGHDLRNPLNSIAMSAALLPRLATTAPAQLSVVSQISTNAGVMGRMISDLLDYTRTRLGAGMPVHAAAMDVGQLGATVIDEFRSAQPTRDIRFHPTGDLAGVWDADRLRQLLSNLLGNAIQHGDAIAPVEITLGGNTAEVWIVVHNAGTPIPPDELPKIFDPLMRGNAAARPRHNRPGSIGLGLYIAREIATSHGGSVTVTSTVAAGTTFTVRLPRHARPTLIAAQADAPNIEAMEPAVASA